MEQIQQMIPQIQNTFQQFAQQEQEIVPRINFDAERNKTQQQVSEQKAASSKPLPEEEGAQVYSPLVKEKAKRVQQYLGGNEEQYYSLCEIFQHTSVENIINIYLDNYCCESANQ